MISLYLINTSSTIDEENLERWSSFIDAFKGEVYLVTCRLSHIREISQRGALSKKIRPLFLPTKNNEDVMVAGYSSNLLSMWNHAIRCALGDITIIANCNLIPPQKRPKLENLKEDTIYIPRICNPDGSRYLDWIRFDIPSVISNGRLQPIHDNLFLNDYDTKPSIQALLPEALVAKRESLQKFRWRLKSDFFIFTQSELKLEPLLSLRFDRHPNSNTTSIGEQVYIGYEIQDDQISNSLLKIADNSQFDFSSHRPNQELELTIAAKAVKPKNGDLKFQLIIEHPDKKFQKYDVSLVAPCYGETITLPMPTTGTYRFKVRANYRGSFLYITRARIRKTKLFTKVTESQLKIEDFSARIAITTFSLKSFPCNFDNQYLATFASKANQYVTITKPSELLSRNYDMLVTTPDIFAQFYDQIVAVGVKVILFCDQGKVPPSKFAIVGNFYYEGQGNSLAYPLLPVRLLTKSSVEYFVIGGKDSFQEKIARRFSNHSSQNSTFCYDPRPDKDTSFSLPFVRCKRVLVDYLREMDLGYIRNYQYHSDIESAGGMVKRKKCLISLPKALNQTLNSINKISRQKRESTYFYFDSALTFMQLDTKLFFDNFASQFSKHHGPRFDWLILMPEQITSLLDSSLVKRIKRGIYICIASKLNPMAELNLKEILPQFKNLEIKLVTNGYIDIARKLPYEIVTYRANYHPIDAEESIPYSKRTAAIIIVPSIKHHHDLLRALDIYYANRGEAGMILCRDDFTGVSFASFDISYQGIDLEESKELLERSRLIVDLEVGEEPMTVRYAASKGIKSVTIKPFNHNLVRSVDYFNPANLFALITTANNEPIQL